MGARLYRATGAAVALVLVATVTACSDGARRPSGELTMWGRAANADYNQEVVRAFNATSRVKVRLTSIPDANFLAKLSTASASGQTPDLVASDVVNAAQLIDTHQLADVTRTVEALPYRNRLAPSYIRAMTHGGRIYGVPGNPDSSALFYNKDLFRRAGLDPDLPPRTWAGIEAAARRISGLGGGVKGFYFAGNCANCNAYTMLPMVWASGSPVLSGDGKSARFDTPQVRAAMDVYRRMWRAGSVPAGAKTDTGANFLAAFETGKVGIEGLGAFAIKPLRTAEFDYGVAPLPGQWGGRGVFAGGDVLAIPVRSPNTAEAERFLSWFLSKRTQIDVVARNGGMTARTDLAVNRYSTKEPGLVAINALLARGRTPYAISYNALFNDPNGPFAGAVQKAVFAGDDSAIAEAQGQMRDILKADQ